MGIRQSWFFHHICKIDDYTRLYEWNIHWVFNDVLMYRTGWSSCFWWYWSLSLLFTFFFRACDPLLLFLTLSITTSISSRFKRAQVNSYVHSIHNDCEYTLKEASANVEEWVLSDFKKEYFVRIQNYYHFLLLLLWSSPVHLWSIVIASW